MTNREKLIRHFQDNHINKVFFTRLSLSNGKPGIMYIYDTLKELGNFKQSFGLYLPIFIKNEDNLKTMDFSSDIDQNLETYSKRIWSESTVMAHRKTKVNGIYGELFLDIYLQAVSNIKPLISYVSKRTFKSNEESPGIDSIGYTFNGTQIEIYLCEAKFVVDKISARNELLKDVMYGHIKSNSGKTITTMAHLTKDFLDEYFGFVLDKEMSCSNADRPKIKVIFDEFNKEINKIINPKKFTDILIEKNIKVNFVCFAIFQANEKHPDGLDKIYQTLIDAIQQQFKSIGIVNYSCEVVFIPTLNTSMTIKEEIDTFYG